MIEAETLTREAFAALIDTTLHPNGRFGEPRAADRLLARLIASGQGQMTTPGDALHLCGITGYSADPTNTRAILANWRLRALQRERISA